MHISPVLVFSSATADSGHHHAVQDCCKAPEGFPCLQPYPPQFLLYTSALILLCANLILSPSCLKSHPLCPLAYKMKFKVMALPPLQPQLPPLGPCQLDLPDLLSLTFCSAPFASKSATPFHSSPAQGGPRLPLGLRRNATSVIPVRWCWGLLLCTPTPQPLPI